MPGAQSCRVHKLLEMLRFIALIALLLAAAAQEAQVQEAAAITAQGRTDVQVSGPLGLALALINQAVTRIGLRNSISLDDPTTTATINALVSYGSTPFYIQRNLEIYTATGNRVDFDFAFLSGYMKAASGVIVTFNGIRLLRAEGGLPTGIFTNSPGATLVMQNCDDHMLVCAPPVFINSLFLSPFSPRPISGLQSGSQNSETAYTFNDVALKPAPYGPNGQLGGYLIHWVNSQLTCDQAAPWTDAMQSACGDLSGQAPSGQCMATVFGHVSGLVCQNPACINACRSAFNQCP